MESFIIEGGHPLKGTITPQGAKNEALEVICTTILTDEPVRITNVPDILDVNNLIKLLKEIGVKVTQNSRHDYTFQSDELNLEYLDSLEFVKKCSSPYSLRYAIRYRNQDHNLQPQPPVEDHGNRGNQEPHLHTHPT